jgi:hypothetical protein
LRTAAQDGVQIALTIKLNTGLLGAFVLTGLAHAQTAEKPELRKQPILYVVGNAHLDTE